MPETLGRPIFGLSKKPGLTLIAKLSRPGTYAVLTSTSPFASAMLMCRIGGMTTRPDASAVKPSPIASTTSPSRATQRRSSASVRMVIGTTPPVRS
jgi:hypothetical protein